MRISRPQVPMPTLLFFGLCLLPAVPIVITGWLI